MKTLLRAIIIEDNEDDVIFLIRHLSRIGYEVREVVVSDLSSFSDALSSHRADVIFCDSNVPGLPTEKALELCRSDSPEIPVVVVSGDISSVLESMKSYATKLVSKDRLSDLDVALAEVLGN
ncbi:MAG: response regulator [Verrucomicrobiales bacterium]|nr:response regulator [Verrucomicrobiales bacterium]